MSTKKNRSKNRSRKGTAPARAVIKLPKPTIEVIIEKTYVTSQPGVEVRKAGTLAHADRARRCCREAKVPSSKRGRIEDSSRCIGLPERDAM
jgi:hypothetical protein